MRVEGDETYDSFFKELNFFFSITWMMELNLVKCMYRLKTYLTNFETSLFYTSL